MIFLGKIVKVRGNKGEVVITPSPQLDVCIPKEGEKIILKSLKYQKEETLVYLKEVGGPWVLKISGSTCIDDALKLVGYSIFAYGEEPETLDSIIEFTVLDIHGNLWGKVVNIEEADLFQLLEVEDPQGNIIYVPLADEIVKSINTEQKTILIDPPDGLKELNQ